MDREFALVKRFALILRLCDVTQPLRDCWRIAIQDNCSIIFEVWFGLLVKQPFLISETIMAPKVAGTDIDRSASRENIAFIRQMLGELRQVAERENAEMLCYLIEMAYVESGDLQARMTAQSVMETETNPPAWR
jgi:hypothetical protein